MGFFANIAQQVWSNLGSTAFFIGNGLVNASHRGRDIVASIKHILPNVRFASGYASRLPIPIVQDIGRIVSVVADVTHSAMEYAPQVLDTMETVGRSLRTWGGRQMASEQADIVEEIGTINY